MTYKSKKPCVNCGCYIMNTNFTKNNMYLYRAFAYYCDNCNSIESNTESAKKDKR